jgi:hypothetical protein
MDFDTAEFLENLFGAAPPAASIPEAEPAAGALVDEPAPPVADLAEVIAPATLDRLAELLLDLEVAGVRVIPEGDNLRLIHTVPVPPDLLAQVKTHKEDLLAALRPMHQPAAPVADLGERVDLGEQVDVGEVIDPPPCPRCGRLEMWQTATGNWRCLRCDPPKTSMRLLERAQGMRRRLGIPANLEADRTLADLRRLTSQRTRSCGAESVVAA